MLRCERAKLCEKYRTGGKCCEDDYEARAFCGIRFDETQPKMVQGSEVEPITVSVKKAIKWMANTIYVKAFMKRHIWVDDNGNLVDAASYRPQEEEHWA